MADKKRDRWGDTQPVKSAPVATATVISIGDLCWQDSAAANTPKPASDVSWNVDLATTQADFIATFLGDAAQASASGDTDAIRLGTTGVYEFDCAAATFAIGDLVGPAKQTGNLLENQKVAAVAGVTMAVGRVAEDVPANATTVKVRIFSKLANGGVQA